MSQFDFGINLESIIQKLNHLIKEIIMSVNFKPLAELQQRQRQHQD